MFRERTFNYNDILLFSLYGNPLIIIREFYGVGIEMDRGWLVGGLGEGNFRG